jgi:eukaryotic-like serine/threonine-protein kinase
MTIAIGQQLGSYEIVAHIGAGGMGEVYKARDTRLNRTVALKVLPSHYADNTEMKGRFEREAQAIAAINHPNICVLYDVGSQDGIAYLVMEYLEGQTVAQRLEKGALPFDVALKIGIQIADALDKAHRHGVVHRDLKPSNVMLTKSGAKLLDFGLAKLKQDAPVGTLSALPTNAAMTEQGTILGTFQYMSPEQLEGREADGRSDIFAFGTLLYEMVIGKKAFEGRSQASLIAAIMHVDPPPLTTQQPLAPPMFDRVVRKCLAKDPEERWQTARDLLTQLNWIVEGGTQIGFPPQVSTERQKRNWLLQAWALLATALLFAATAALGFIYFRPVKQADEVRFNMPVPPMPSPFLLSVSPDGRWIAFEAAIGGNPRTLFLRPMGSTTAQQLAPIEGTNTTLFWSPDSRHVAFFAGGRLKKIDVAGGPPQNVCDVPTGGPLQGTWNADGVIIFGSTNGLYRVSAAGGEPTKITSIDQSLGEVGHRLPYFLPDGHHYLYLAGSNDTTKNFIYVGSLDSQERKRLLMVNSMPVYAEPGYLLFNREGTLFAQPFDAKRLEFSAEPIRVADEIAWSPADGRAAFSASQNGVLVYRTGSSLGALMQLRWVDRTGKEVGKVAMPGPYFGIDLSPDGKRIAVHRHDGSASGGIWVVEPDGATMSRLTFDPPKHYSSPIWSPDGSRILFGFQRNGKSALATKLADGTGNEEMLVESDVRKLPMAWSADNKFILYYVGENGGDVWMLPLNGDRKPLPFLQSPFSEAHPQVSSDGKWIAYRSAETGRSEIYIRPAQGEGRWQVSTDGGFYPRWRRDGKELFYMSSASTGKMMAADIRVIGSSLQVTAHRVLFDSDYVGYAHGGEPYHPYAASADGQRFLIPTSNVTADPSSTSLAVVVNWTAALNKK